MTETIVECVIFKNVVESNEVFIYIASTSLDYQPFTVS